MWLVGTTLKVPVDRAVTLLVVCVPSVDVLISPVEIAVKEDVLVLKLEGIRKGLPLSG